jgi:glycosyltransferase involved in cell wall biosynthesis
LLDAFASLLPKRPELRLFIVGEGSLRATLESHAERLGVAHACRFLGHRRDPDSIYHALDVFVQSSDYEGSPNVVLEAMAFETPVVATDVGGTADLIHDQVHGLVVPRRDPQRLAHAIAQVLQDRSATKERVAAARARVEGELSFDARMRAVEHVYQELMADRRSRPAPGDAAMSRVPHETNA